MALQNYFSQIFGDSPITPLQRHFEKIVGCIEHLESFFESSFSGDWDAASSCCDALVASKKDADQVKNNLRMHLPKSLHMPMDRRDILEILHMQDLIAAQSLRVVTALMGRQLAFPKQLQANYRLFLEQTVSSIRLAQRAVNELDELVATGFSGDEAKLVESMIRELNDAENKFEQLEFDLNKDMHKLEASMSPVDVMFLYDCIKRTGVLGRVALSAGNRLQLFIAK